MYKSHDRGIQLVVNDVVVKLFYATILENGKYPDLPPDFGLHFLIIHLIIITGSLLENIK